MLHIKNTLPLFFVVSSLASSSFGGDWLKLGRQSIARQNFDLAVEYFSNEIQENPENASAYLERAKAYRFQGEIVKSAEDKQRAYELDPDLIKRLYLPEERHPGKRRPIQSPVRAN